MKILHSCSVHISPSFLLSQYLAMDAIHSFLPSPRYYNIHDCSYLPPTLTYNLYFPLLPPLPNHMFSKQVTWHVILQ